jgi:hypothetical protein
MQDGIIEMKIVVGLFLLLVAALVGGLLVPLLCLPLVLGFGESIRSS